MIRNHSYICDNIYWYIYIQIYYLLECTIVFPCFVFHYGGSGNWKPPWRGLPGTETCLGLDLCEGLMSRSMRRWTKKWNEVVIMCGLQLVKFNLPLAKFRYVSRGRECLWLELREFLVGAFLMHLLIDLLLELFVIHLILVQLIELIVDVILIFKIHPSDDLVAEFLSIQLFRFWYI